MASRMTPEELEQILDLAFADGDEVAVLQKATSRQVYTNCCSYSYVGLGNDGPHIPPVPDPPPPKPKPK